MRPERVSALARLARLVVLTAAVAALPVTALAAETSANASFAPRGDERIIFRTNFGDLVVALFPHVAPKHCEQVLRLVRLGVYDSTWFYRVEPNFVAQLTDAANRKLPLSPEQRAALVKVPAEFSPTIAHRRGHLSMARQDNDVNSAESSFSIMLATAPHLDGKYTVFGELVWGEQVLEAIATAPRGARNSPRQQIVVEAAQVKTAEEVATMAQLGQLRGPPPRQAAGGPAADDDPARSRNPVMIGIGVMILFSLVAFVASGRWQSHRVGAFNLLAVLVGCFLIIREYAPRARDSWVLAVGLFVGIIALFKLMNRFESARRPASPPQTDRPSPST